MSFSPSMSKEVLDPTLTTQTAVEEVVYEDGAFGSMEEELVEEEVTDNEEDTVDQSSGIDTGSPPAYHNTSIHSMDVGKVNPSKEVMNMELSSPEKKGPGDIFPKKKEFPFNSGTNFFPTFGKWDERTMSAIEIRYPTLGPSCETTNELTRGTRPEARYWKAPITFHHGPYVSTTLRFDNVYIPYNPSEKYGSDYVYLCLPGIAAKYFEEAGKRTMPVRVTEASLEPDPERWWKVASNVSDSFGVIPKSTKNFHVTRLPAIFDSTNAGISCSVILKFNCKASTLDKSPLKPTTLRTVAVEVVQGFITGTDLNIQMPKRISRKKTKVQPVATSSDVASDSLMERLAALGI